MLFSSPEFIFIFLPLVLLVYFSLAQLDNKRPAKYWLVVASLFFYGWWEVKYLVLISISILVNFYMGDAIIASRRKDRRKFSKRMLIAGVLFNVALLSYYKYANFILENFSLVTNQVFTPLNIVLPLAISFFTFLQIAYLVDCYKDHDKRYDFLDYTLFVTFFPHLIAGPLIHHSQMMPQFSLKQNWSFISGNFAKGLFIFSLGLFKKMVIADSFAVWANAGFDGQHALNFFDAWGASLSYTIQLYYDFSGYSDMAIGASLMFNIALPINFNSPYKAVNIQDFWRRWHITLSHWLRDYVYIPLGGNRGSQISTSINLFATFLIGGIWHGAGWTFVIWGALHGGALVVHRYWQRAGLKMNLLLGWFCTFMFVNLAWVYFRAQSLDDAHRVIKGMFGLNGFGVSGHFREMVSSFWPGARRALGLADQPFSTDLLALPCLLAVGALTLLAPNVMQMSNFTLTYKGRLAYRKEPRFALFAGLVGGMGAVLLFTSSSNEFLYFNF
ncbi:MBOAT family O-acyltransferase [Pseudomonas pseudonitroreducens]|uniref:MBOAT family O-acyltransferase n=1 Tax=Pseudomonas pseudonitroreducens TaxID=2892326 RepID=UPI001F3E8968|nr:MBOAT family protein [Pseudomonas pseudonitroreducens]